MPNETLDYAVAVRVVPPYELIVTFADGTERRIDMEQELWGEVFEPLRDPAFVALAEVDPDFGSVFWPNGADLSPEFLYYGEAGPPPGYYGGVESEQDSPVIGNVR